MSTFQIATGHNQAGSLADVRPFQPRSSGLVYPARVRATNGAMILKGLPYTDWIWDFQEAEGGDYTNCLTDCGLSATTPTASANVTIKTLLSDFKTWANFNAIATLPEPGITVDHDRGKVLRVVIRFVALEAL